jgi:XTP/dITP diphosphohydrolase|tara:strand:- start:545 stop:1150 length:606 start_codon:yes stop_codon:yes gene_type:complete
MKRKIVIATMNNHKVSEIKALIGDCYDVMTQDAFSIPSVPETGKSFEENALIKANVVAKKTNLLTLADDSGLEVDLLGGNPGIYSARYAGPNSSDNENNKKLIEELDKYKGQKILARFHSVIALVDPSADAPKIFHGTWEGRIIFDQKGNHGFGYDPLFYIDEHKCTAAELSQQEKNILSHRAKAMKSLCDYLAEYTRNIK